MRFRALVISSALAVVDGPVECAPQVLPSLEEYDIRVFTVADGLGASDVRDLAQGPDGYLYLAQGRGLARYDGYGFEPVPLPGLKSTFAEKLHVDRAGRLWVLTRGGELGYLEGSTFRALPPPPQTQLDISETSDGTLWLGGPAGLTQVTADAAVPYTVFKELDGLPRGRAHGVYDVGSAERVAVTRGGLARLGSAQRGKLTFSAFGPRCEVKEVVRADASGLWVTCVRGYRTHEVLRYAGGRFTRYGADVSGERMLDLPDGSASALNGRNGPWRTVYTRRREAPPGLKGRLLGGALSARDGTRWLVLHDSSTQFDHLVWQRGADLEELPLRDRLDFHSIHRLLEDGEGSIWAATDRGLFQLAPRKVLALTRRHGLAERFTVPVLQSADGSVWVGTWGGGLHHFVRGRLARIYTRKDDLPEDRIRALYQDVEGTLWVGTSVGFAALRAGRVMLSQPGLSEVRAFAETPAAAAPGTGTRLWIGTTNRLLYRETGRMGEHRPGFWQGRQIWALHTDSRGALWIASERGLFRLAGDSLREFGEADGLRSRAVVSIYAEADGVLWFGTYEHGLHRWRNGRFVAVTTQHGLHHNGVWCMLADDRGGIWLSSDQGIFHVERRRLHAVADSLERGRPPPSLSPLVFTEAEGMPSRESNRGSPGGWRLRDGRLVFNNMAGLVVIDPTHAIRSPASSRTVVRRVSADGSLIAPAGSAAARIPAGTRQLALDFAALSFLTPEQTRYRYQLVGYDGGWVEAGTRRRASYTNLPPGRYTFRVQSATGGGGWTGAVAAYSLVLEAFIWQTWWARALAVASILIVLALAYRYRVRHLLAMQQLRLRIAADLHDDIGSSLSSIALLSEMLQRRPHPDELEQRQLARIGSAALETVGALRDVVWLVDPKHEQLGALVDRMRVVASDLLHGTSHTFRAHGISERRVLAMLFQRNVFLVYKEALHNAARHARAQHVHIEVNQEGGQLRVHVSDDGVGFDPGAAGNGRGLENMRARAEQVGGRLVVESRTGGGTRLEFSARVP